MRIAKTVLLLAALTLPGLAAAKDQTAEGPAAVARIAEARATVESVDLAERSVVLKRDDGVIETINVPPEARNLPQVKPGDRVALRYTQAVASEPAKADGSAPVESSGGIGLAPPGSRPAGAMYEAVRIRVKVDAIDRKANTATVTGPGGETKTIAVRSPRMRAFLKTVKVGDLVDVTLVEALEMAVLPPA